MKEKGKYLLRNIVFTKSILERRLDNQNESFQNNVNINTYHQLNDNQLLITLEVVLRTSDSADEEPPTLNCEVQCVGIFEIENKDNLDLPIDKFATLNGPAIILPYIRQHLTDLTIKAGFNPYYLPPVNFHKLNENK